MLRLTLEALLALVLSTHSLVASSFLAAVVCTADEYPLLFTAKDVTHQSGVLDVDDLRLLHRRHTLSHHWLTWLHHHRLWLTWLHHHLLLHGLSLHDWLAIVVAFGVCLFH